jgi:hypothetical protein
MTPLDLLARTLRGDLAWAGDGAWDTHLLAAAADHHGVGPLVWRALHAARDRPHGLYETLAATRHVDLAHEMLRGREIARVLDALGQRSIPVLVTKGTALAYSLYPEPWLRPRMDTDLMVVRESVAAAERVLRDIGYRAAPGVSTGEFVSHQAPYEHRDAHGVSHVIDLHWKAVNPAMLADALPFELLWQDALELSRHGLRARIPSLAGSLLLACVHRLAHHQQHERLVWLYDIHLLARALDAGGWDRVTTLACDRGIAAICRHGLEASAARLATHVPRGVLEALGAAPLDEASRAYTEHAQSRRDVLVADLHRLPRWRDRLRLVAEHAFPPASFIMARYPGRRRAWLPLFYAHRLLAGAWRWMRG